MTDSFEGLLIDGSSILNFEAKYWSLSLPSQWTRTIGRFRIVRPLFVSDEECLVRSIRLLCSKRWWRDTFFPFLQMFYVPHDSRVHYSLRHVCFLFLPTAPYSQSPIVDVRVLFLLEGTYLSLTPLHNDKCLFIRLLILQASRCARKKVWFRKLKTINTLTFVSDSLSSFCEYVICVYDVVQGWWQEQTCAYWSARLDWVDSICKWIRRWTMPSRCFSF